MTKIAKFGVVLRAIKIKAEKDENKYVNALLVMEKKKVEKKKENETNASHKSVYSMFLCFLKEHAYKVDAALEALKQLTFHYIH